MQALNQLDILFFRFLNLELVSPWLDILAKWASDLIPLVPLLVLAAWLLLNLGVRGRVMFVGVALLFVFTDYLTTQELRPFIERLRPYASLEGVRYSFGAEWRISTAASLATQYPALGFPSAHAANSMGPAVFMLLFLRRAGLVLGIMSLAVGFSRVYLGLHYPGDVLAGFAWGAIWGAAMGLATKVVLKRFFPLPVYYAKPRFTAAVTPGRLRRFSLLKKHGKLDLARKLLLKGDCILVKSGLPLYLERSYPSGMVRVRPVDSRLCLYAPWEMLAVNPPQQPDPAPDFQPGQGKARAAQQAA